MVYELKSQLSKASWCQRDAETIYRTWRILLFCGSDSYWRHKV